MYNAIEHKQLIVALRELIALSDARINSERDAVTLAIAFKTIMREVMPDLGDLLVENQEMLDIVNEALCHHEGSIVHNY